MVRLESLTLLFISSPTNSSSIGIDTILTNPAGHHNYCNRHGCHHRPWSEYLRIQYMVRPPPMVFGTALARHAPYAPALAYAFIRCRRLYTNYLYSTSQISLGSILEPSLLDLSRSSLRACTRTYINLLYINPLYSTSQISPCSISRPSVIDLRRLSWRSTTHCCCCLTVLYHHLGTRRLCVWTGARARVGSGYSGQGHTLHIGLVHGIYASAFIGFGINPFILILAYFIRLNMLDTTCAGILFCPMHASFHFISCLPS